MRPDVAYMPEFERARAQATERVRGKRAVFCYSTRIRFNGSVSGSNAGAWLGCGIYRRSVDRNAAAAHALGKASAGISHAPRVFATRSLKARQGQTPRSGCEKGWWRYGARGPAG